MAACVASTSSAFFPERSDLHEYNARLRMLSAQQQQQTQPTQQDIDDDLVALVAADTFSLESQRDRELLLLSSFLQNALPSAMGGPSGASASSGATGGAQWISSSSHEPQSSMSSSCSWNGWKPTDNATAGLSAPCNSFSSSSSSFPHQNPSQSTSASSAFGFAGHPNTAQSTPLLSSNLPLPSESEDGLPLSMLSSYTSGPFPQQQQSALFEGFGHDQDDMMVQDLSRSSTKPRW